jgi:hypothetical protein
LHQQTTNIAQTNDKLFRGLRVEILRISSERDPTADEIASADLVWIRTDVQKNHDPVIFAEVDPERSGSGAKSKSTWQPTLRLPKESKFPIWYGQLVNRLLTQPCHVVVELCSLSPGEVGFAASLVRDVQRKSESQEGYLFPLGLHTSGTDKFLAWGPFSRDPRFVGSDLFGTIDKYYRDLPRIFEELGHQQNSAQLIAGYAVIPWMIIASPDDFGKNIATYWPSSTSPDSMVNRFKQAGTAKPEPLADAPSCILSACRRFYEKPESLAIIHAARAALLNALTSRNWANLRSAMEQIGRNLAASIEVVDSHSTASIKDARLEPRSIMKISPYRHILPHVHDEPRNAVECEDEDIWLTDDRSCFAIDLPGSNCRLILLSGTHEARFLELLQRSRIPFQILNQIVSPPEGHDLSPQDHRTVIFLREIGPLENKQEFPIIFEDAYGESYPAVLGGRYLVRLIAIWNLSKQGACLAYRTGKNSYNVGVLRGEKIYSEADTLALFNTTADKRTFIRKVNSAISDSGLGKKGWEETIISVKRGAIGVTSTLDGSLRGWAPTRLCQTHTRLEIRLDDGSLTELTEFVARDPNTEAVIDHYRQIVSKSTKKEGG